MFRLVLAVLALFLAQPAAAFCGFYVARGDGALYNRSSVVVFARERHQSVITMSSDYRGAASDFAMVVPTPQVLAREDIRIVDAKIVQHLDDYTAPRLVEYFEYARPCDRGPESPVIVEETAAGCGLFCRREDGGPGRGARSLGVTVEAKYAVGDYDIQILGARESDGLVTYLVQEGYTLPPGAEPVLAEYIRKKMKFFVARVNLTRHAAGEAQDLPPLQIRFRSTEFMLPIQLGKLNGQGAQDALFLMLTPGGRVETVNYPQVALPTDVDVPLFVEKVFPDFYKAMFARAVGPRGGVVMEYAWDMNWCDPCAADPLTNKELRALGTTWQSALDNAPQQVFVTRLHAQYGPGQMDQDVMFRDTGDRENFQGRYVMNHPVDPAKVDLACAEGKAYIAGVRKRFDAEAGALSKLTGWSVSSIRANVRKTVPAAYR